MFSIALALVFVMLGSKFVVARVPLGRERVVIEHDLGVLRFWWDLGGPRETRMRPEDYEPAADWVRPSMFPTPDGPTLGVPMWLLALMGVGLAWKRLCHTRVRAGTCPNCGYSLRGLPLNDGKLVCPECGETFSGGEPESQRETPSVRRYQIAILLGLLLATAMVAGRRTSIDFWTPLRREWFGALRYSTGTLLLERYSMRHPAFIGGALPSAQSWYTLAMPRIKFGGRSVWLQVPLWPIPAGLIIYGARPLIRERLAKRKSTPVAETAVTKGERLKRARNRAWIALHAGLAATAMLLCVKATLVRWEDGARSTALSCDLGLLRLARCKSASAGSLLDVRDFEPAKEWFVPAWQERWGNWELRVPAWMVTVGIAVGGISGLVRTRPRKHVCEICGYPFQGLPALHGRTVCPECGEPAPTPVAPTSLSISAWRWRYAAIVVGIVLGAATAITSGEGLDLWSTAKFGGSLTFTCECGVITLRPDRLPHAGHVGEPAPWMLPERALVMPRIEWGGDAWYVRLPLWPMSAGFIAWGAARLPLTHKPRMEVSS